MAPKSQIDIQALEERLDLAKRGRRPFESDWLLNIGYVGGEQYINTTLDTVSRVVATEQTGPTPVHNNFIKIARTERAKLLKVAPVPSALPVTGGDDDMYAAQILNAYYRHLMDTWRYDNRLRQGSYWLVVTGNVFFKWYWAGGSARMAVVSPFDVYPDPYATTFDDCRWIIHSQFMDEDMARERFGMSENDAKELRVTSSSNMSGAESKLYTNYGTATGESLPGVHLYEYWERPSVSVPKGRLVVWSGTKIVSEGPYPYDHQRLPFTHASHIERGNTKWAASSLDFIRPLQDELNRVERQIIENRNLANGIWFIPAEVELEQDITSAPRQVINWTGPPNLTPRDWFVQPQGMAQWVSGEPERIKATMQDIVAQHEVSNAGVPGRVESGQAIQLLQETDDSVLKDTVHSLEEAIANGFEMAGALYRQYATDESLTLRVYDKNGAVLVREFHRDQVPTGQRVRCQTTTGLPQTIAGKWDRVLNLVQYKLIDPSYALDLLDLAPEDPELRPDTLDIRNADSENVLLANGKPVLAALYENHGVHIERHRRYRKTAEYRQLVSDDPDAARRFDAHELSHFDEWKKQLALEADVQSAAQPPQGAPADQGAPPPQPDSNGGPPPVA